MSTVGDLAEVVLQYYDGVNLSTYINTFGFRCIATPADLTELGNDFKTALVKNTSGGFLACTVGAIGSAALTVRDVVPGTGAPAQIAYTNVPGSLATDSWPPQCASVISWRTALAGRSYRGRTYLPPGDEGNQARGAISAALVTLIGAAATQMLTVFGPAGTNGKWQFGVITRRHNGVPTIPPQWNAVTSALIDPTVKTQRRREIGVGA